MKKLIAIIICALFLTGCAEDVSVEEKTSDKYNVGDEVDLGGVEFNIYKINDNSNELYLLAQNNIATTVFSDVEREQKYMHDYEGSLVEVYVDEFVDGLEDKGLVVKDSGIIDKDDLYNLGFKHSDSLSGLPYKIDNSPEFVGYEDMYWVGGYCKYDTMSWAYSHGTLDTQSCDDEYGVRPIIVIEPSEIGKQLQEVDSNLTIKEIVESNSAWTSEGGIENPYDRFYFDCENMIFKNVFESSALSQTSEFAMKFIDNKTIQVDGLMQGYDYPAEITIVNETKLRVRFIDNIHNNGDYFLNKAYE